MTSQLRPTSTKEAMIAMKHTLAKALAVGLLALGALGQNAHAQALNLPLSSVGSEVGWDQRAGAIDDYRLAVFERAANAPLKVELYSPEINLEDYRNKRNVQNYYGDEIYAPGAKVSSRFALNERGSSNPLIQRTFGTSNRHHYETLLSASLSQGFYGLPVRTAGNGKNAFGFRLSPGIAVEASQFTVVTRGQFGRDQLAARLTIGQAAVGKVFRIENFDADGPQEMQLFVRFPNGTRRPLTSSGDVQWAGNDIRVSADMRGEWAILVRILPTTKQFSNSVKLRLKLDGQPYFARMPFEAGPALPKPNVDLSLSKTVNTSKATVGQQLTYTLSVVNNGPDAAPNVVLRDTLPAGLGGIKAENAQQTGNTLTWNLGNLRVGERKTLSVEATAQTPGTLVNAASVSTSDPEVNLENNRAEARLEVVAAPVPKVDLALNKTANPTQLKQGQNVRYTLSVVNYGPDTATNVVLSDTLPEGLSNPKSSGMAAAGKALSWALGNLAVGERRVVEVEATAQMAGRWVNNAQVDAKEADTNPNNNRASAPVEVLEPSIDLVLGKSVSPSKIELGQNATFTLTLQNTGPDPATNVVLSDALPAGVELVQSSPSAQQSGNILTWNLPSLGVGESRSFSVEVKGRIAGTHLNQASAKATQTDRQPANNSASASLEVVAPPPPTPPTLPAAEPKADLALSKSVSPATAKTGDSLRYTLTVVNNGSDTATNIVLRDALPQGLDPITFSGATLSNRTLTWNLGSLAVGERKSVEVEAKATGAGRLTNTASVTAKETDPNPANNQAEVSLEVSPPPVVEPTPPPVRERILERESEVTLAARLASTPSAGVVVLSDRIPAGARYVLGSSRLLRQGPAGSLEQAVITNPTRENADPIADPLVFEDRLFWVLPAPLRSGYVLGYRLSHSNSLEFAPDRLGVVLQAPQSRSAGSPRTPGQQPFMGSLGDVRVLVGQADLLGALAKAKPVANDPKADASAVTVGGPAASIAVYPSRPLTTDRADQPELTVLVRDSAGNPSSARHATVWVSPEPSSEDAEPTVPGFQIRLQNGEGRIPLSNLGPQPQGGTPDTVNVEVRADQAMTQASFAVQAAQRPWVVSGAFSVQASLTSSGFGLESTLRAFGRGNMGAALFTGAVNTGADFSMGSFLFRDVNLLPPSNPYQRFPLLGDSSSQGSEVSSSDSLYVRLEQNQNYLQYGQLNTDFQGLLTGYNAGYNGLRGVVREGGFGLNAFAALVPNANRQETLAGDGTRFYRLGLLATERPVLPSSEQVVKVVRERSNPNLVLSRTLLLRNSDYEVDYSAGTLMLREPLQPTDLNGNPQSLEVAYALSSATAQRELRGGVQAGFASEGFGIRATLLSLSSTASGLVGLGAYMGSQDLRLEVEGAAPLNSFSSFATAARALVRLDNFGLEARYQDIPLGFQDPRGPVTAARDFSLSSSLRLGWLGLNANYSLNQNHATASSTQQMSAEGRLGNENLALLVGGGASFGLSPQNLNNFQTQLSYATVGLEAQMGGFGIGLRQRIGLGNTPGATDFSLDIALSPQFGIRLQNRLTLSGNGLYLSGALGVRGSFDNRDLLRTLLGNSTEAPDPGALHLGSTHIAATYDLSNLDGEAGRTRIGLETTIPLSNQLQLGLSSNLTVADSGQGGASGGLGLRYTGDDLQASLSAEASAQASTPGLKTVVGAGAVWKPSDDFILSPQVTYVREASSAEGLQFGLAGAYRADRFSLLTNNRFKSGFFRDADGVVGEGELRTGYQADERFFFRLGGAYRFSDSGVFTGQVGAGLTYYFTDVFGAGLNGSYLFQPATGSSQASFGLEASLRFSPGLSLALGVNLWGTQTSLMGFQTQPGLFVRLDWLFDEGLFGLK